MLFLEIFEQIDFQKPRTKNFFSEFVNDVWSQIIFIETLRMDFQDSIEIGSSFRKHLDANLSVNLNTVDPRL